MCKKKSNHKSNSKQASTIKLKPGWEYDDSGKPIRTRDKKELTPSFRDGGPCKNCGNVEDRWKDGSCRPCRLRRAKEKYAKRKLDPEEYAAWLARSRALYAERKQIEMDVFDKPREMYMKDATPPWLGEYDIAEIEALYFKARLLTRRTGIPHVVDHIIPLRHPEVCGLHVPWNMQVITAEDNAAKKNSYFKDPNSL